MISEAHDTELRKFQKAEWKRVEGELSSQGALTLRRRLNNKAPEWLA